MTEDGEDIISVSYNYKRHMDDFKPQHIPNVLQCTGSNEKNKVRFKTEIQLSRWNIHKITASVSLPEEYNWLIIATLLAFSWLAEPEDD